MRALLGREIVSTKILGVAQKTASLHDEVDLRVRQAEDEAKFQDRRNSTCTPGFDRQPDETSDQQFDARERRRFLLDVEQLR